MQKKHLIFLHEYILLNCVYLYTRCLLSVYKIEVKRLACVHQLGQQS